MGWRKWQGERRQPLGPERSEEGTRNPRPCFDSVNREFPFVRSPSRISIRHPVYASQNTEVVVPDFKNGSVRMESSKPPRPGGAGGFDQEEEVYGKQERLAPTVTRVAVQAPLANMPLTLTGSPTFKSANVMRVATVVALVFNR